MTTIISRARTLSHQEAFVMDLNSTSGAGNDGIVFTRACDMEAKEPDFLIDGLIEKDTLGTIFAPSGTYKSFMAIALASSVATGVDFYGNKVEQGPAFYIYGEGGNGIARRFGAWTKEYGTPSTVFTSGDMPDLRNPRAAEELQVAIGTMARAHGMPRLIIIDTLARAFGDGDENATKDMNAFINAVGAIKKAYPGCVFLIVHHTGHGEQSRARGSSAFNAALDFSYSMEKNGGLVRLTATKTKDAEEPSTMFFEVKDVSLGVDKKGNPFGSAVLSQTDAPAKGKKKLTPPQTLAIETYKIAALKHGKTEDGEFFGIHLDHWRQEFIQRHHGDKPDSKRTAFNRARGDLTGKLGLMTVNHDLYLLKGDLGSALLDELRERDNRTDTDNA